MILPHIQDIQRSTASHLREICSEFNLDELQKTNPGTGNSDSFDLIHDTSKRF